MSLVLAGAGAELPAGGGQGSGSTLGWPELLVALGVALLLHLAALALATVWERTEPTGGASAGVGRTIAVRLGGDSGPPVDLARSRPATAVTTVAVPTTTPTVEDAASAVSGAALLSEAAETGSGTFVSPATTGPAPDSVAPTIPARTAVVTGQTAPRTEAAAPRTQPTADEPSRPQARENDVAAMGQLQNAPLSEAAADAAHTASRQRDVQPVRPASPAVSEALARPEATRANAAAAAAPLSAPQSSATARAATSEALTPSQTAPRLQAETVATDHPSTVAPRADRVPVPLARPRSAAASAPARRTANTGSPTAPDRERGPPAAAPAARADAARGSRADGQTATGMAATDASAAAADAHNPQAVAQARAAHAQAVAAWIARHKVYPDRARRRGQHGTAVLLLELTGAGGVRAARIADSSGHAALDRAVLDLVRRAAPFPAAPTVLGGQVLSFRVPVRFTLR